MKRPLDPSLNTHNTRVDLVYRDYTPFLSDAELDTPIAIEVTVDIAYRVAVNVVFELTLDEPKMFSQTIEFMDWDTLRFIETKRDTSAMFMVRTLRTLLNISIVEAARAVNKLGGKPQITYNGEELR